MTDQSDKPKLGTRPPLGLKRTVETGKVKQSFSHGRSNTVVVEVKKRRILAKPGETPAPAPEAAAPRPKQRRQPPPRLRRPRLPPPRRHRRPPPAPRRPRRAPRRSAARRSTTSCRAASFRRNCSARPKKSRMNIARGSAPPRRPRQERAERR